MIRITRKSFWLVAFLATLVFGIQPSRAVSACPPQAELRKKAQVVVEARLKSWWVGDSGLLIDVPGAPSMNRVTRAEFEIRRVIKGEFTSKEVVAIGFMYPPGPYRQLSLMATLFGAGQGLDTFEWELSREDPFASVGFYSLNRCLYYRFPEAVEKGAG